MSNSLLAEFSHGAKKRKGGGRREAFLSPWENSANRENEQPKLLKKNLEKTWPETSVRQAQLEKRRASEREAVGSNPGLTNISGSLNNWEERAAFVKSSTNG